ncbi:MAG: ribonuclease R [Rhodospirillaceae bacterium]|nr:ribonuclease R [Rhodospirillaceae bacterium]
MSLPSKDEILAFIRDSKTPGSKLKIGKRDIARAFNIKGPAKIALKALLKNLTIDGDVERGPGGFSGNQDGASPPKMPAKMPASQKGRPFGSPSPLPAVDVIDITHTDRDGDLFAKPVKWDRSVPPPEILVVQPKSHGGTRGKYRPITVGVGDRVLAKLFPAGDDTYEARPIKKIAAAPTRLLGVYELADGVGRLRPVDKKYRYEVSIARGDVGPALHGDLVAAEVFEVPRYGPQRARILERLGPMNASRNLSLIAIHAQGIPHAFNDEAVAEAANAKGATLGERIDLRQIPLITIDGEDARDFDDAVFAEPDTDPANPGGWHLMVAIADVAWYVRAGEALDRDAYLRGNSVYFPDRVVPMLPEELSNGWCSLKPDEDRPVLVADMWIDDKGKPLRHKIIRGLMRSRARLTYTQVQAARDGTPDAVTTPLMAGVIAPLYGAYASLDAARAKRGTLELDLVERKIVVDRDGKILGVEPRARYDSHKLIEEFMIAANVAAAETLSSSAYPAVYRVHDRPDPERVDGLREALQTIDLKFPHAGETRAADFNRVLAQVRGGPHVHMVNTLVLRTQAQAIYSPGNIGHFGLGLKKYVHFTSPIRRYSDLLVHRALIAAGRLGEGGWNPKHDPDLIATCEYISMTERRAALAERQTVDRFTAAFLADRTGAVFRGRISGVSRFGLFVNLDETGADGILPMRNLPQDFYDLDERGHRVVGRRRGMQLRVGDVIDVNLLETNEVAGGIVFEYSGRVDSGGRDVKALRKEAPRAPTRPTRRRR